MYRAGSATLQQSHPCHRLGGQRSGKPLQPGRVGRGTAVGIEVNPGHDPSMCQPSASPDVSDSGQGRFKPSEWICLVAS